MPNAKSTPTFGKRPHRVDAYNVQRPLNAKAAAWVVEHLDRLPLMQADLTAGL